MNCSHLFVSEGSLGIAMDCHGLPWIATVTRFWACIALHSLESLEVMGMLWQGPQLSASEFGASKVVRFR